MASLEHVIITHEEVSFHRAQFPSDVHTLNTVLLMCSVWVRMMLSCSAKPLCCHKARTKLKVSSHGRQSELAAVEAEAAGMGGASSEAMAEYRRLRQVHITPRSSSLMC